MTLPGRAPASAAWLAARSILWTLLLPGVQAGYVPWTFFGLARARFEARDPLHWLAVVLIVPGAALLLACIFEFARSGRGTLSPADPPSTLVVRGPYRYVRNPMYVGVTAIGLGEWLLTHSPGMLVYLACWFVVVNLFVMLFEEPTLRSTFSESYERYTRSVRRWIPSLRPRDPTG